MARSSMGKRLRVAHARATRRCGISAAPDVHRPRLKVKGDVELPSRKKISDKVKATCDGIRYVSDEKPVNLTLRPAKQSLSRSSPVGQFPASRSLPPLPPPPPPSTRFTSPLRPGFANFIESTADSIAPLIKGNDRPPPPSKDTVMPLPSFYLPVC